MKIENLKFQDFLRLKKKNLQTVKNINLKKKFTKPSCRAFTINLFQKHISTLFLRREYIVFMVKK